MAYLRRGCFTISTGSMSAERKLGTDGDEKKKNSRKEKRAKKKMKEKGRNLDGTDSLLWPMIFDIHVNCYVIYFSRVFREGIACLLVKKSIKLHL